MPTRRMFHVFFGSQLGKIFQFHVKNNLKINNNNLILISRKKNSLMDPPGVRHQCLMLADTESEKTKWVVALNELHRILKKNSLPSRIVFR